MNWKLTVQLQFYSWKHFTLLCSRRTCWHPNVSILLTCKRLIQILTNFSLLFECGKTVCKFEKCEQKPSTCFLFHRKSPPFVTLYLMGAQGCVSCLFNGTYACIGRLHLFNKSMYKGNVNIGCLNIDIHVVASLKYCGVLVYHCSPISKSIFW